MIVLFLVLPLIRVEKTGKRGKKVEANKKVKEVTAPLSCSPLTPLPFPVS